MARNVLVSTDDEWFEAAQIVGEQSDNYLPQHAGLEHLGPEGPINVVNRDGVVWISILSDNPIMEQQLDWGAIWIEPLEKPDPNIYIGEWRLDPGTSIKWQVMAQSKDGLWVWLESEGSEATEMPTTLHRSIVSSWKPVSGPKTYITTEHVGIDNRPAPPKSETD